MTGEPFDTFNVLCLTLCVLLYHQFSSLSSGFNKNVVQKTLIYQYFTKNIDNKGVFFLLWENIL